MNGQTVSPKNFRSTYVEQEILDEAWTNLALVQRKEVYADDKIGDCADRQEILERWVYSQQILCYVDCERNRLACLAHSLLTRNWQEGYNSPSLLGLNDIPESLEPESSRGTGNSRARTSTTSRGRGSYNKR